ncbi:hypothetical protein [Massilia glaciei]|nr:hypothetical protein [Massilia glaciei]
MLKSQYQVDPIEERRSATQTAAKVDVGVILHQMLGQQDAAAYLHTSHVPDAVAARVLSHADDCRRQDPRARTGPPTTPAPHALSI